MLVSNAPRHIHMPLGLVDNLECRMFESGSSGIPPVALDLSGLQNGRQDPAGAVAREVLTVRLKPSIIDVVNVGTHHASANWAAVSIPDTLAHLSCLVLYELELKEQDPQAGSVSKEQPAVSAATGKSKRTEGPVMRASASPWRVVFSGTNTSFQLDYLKPGRTYQLRLLVKLQLHPEDEPFIKVLCDASEPSSLTTQPTAPSQAPPPTLAVKDRKALKVKWAVPEETGGAGPLHYRLYCNPAPTEVDPGTLLDEEGFLEVYSGEERAVKVAKLVPGMRYSFKLKVHNAVGEGRTSRCSFFYTQATVPSMPDPPMVLSTSAASIILMWRSPHDNGSPVSSYRLELDDGRGGLDYQLVYAGPGLSATASGLQSGLRYSFRLLAENDEGKSMWSQPTLSTTAAVPPSSPTQLAMVGASKSSATLSWQAPEDCGGGRVAVYEVQLQAKSAAAVEHAGGEWLSIFEGDALACTINSLRAGCTYRARVRAASAAGWGLCSIPIDVCSSPDVPDSPEPPTPQITESRFLGVAWDPPTHNGGAKISFYTLEVAQAAPCACGTCPSSVMHVMAPCEAALHGTSVQMNLNGDVQTAEIRDLQPGTPYFFRVKANNPLGPGTWSDWSRMMTHAEPPAAPADLCASATGNASIFICWSVPDGLGAPVTAYMLEMARQQDAMTLSPAEGGTDAIQHSAEAGARRQECLGFGAFTAAYRGPGTSFEVKGLLPATTYAFRVCALNAVGPGAWCDPSEARTAPAAPGTVEILEACGTGPCQVLLEWSTPTTDNGAPVTGYVVDVAPGGGKRAGGGGGSWPPWTQAYSGPAHKCLVEKLLPGREYVFRVRAVNTCGVGPAPARPVAAATLPAPPTAPLRLQCSQRGATQMRLKWDHPEHDYGATVSEYQLEIGCQQQQQADEIAGDPPSSETTASAAAATRISEPRRRSSSSGSSCSRATSWCVAYAGKEMSARISDLDPNTRYWLRVQAISSAGAGTYGDELPLVTSMAPPGPPERMQVLVQGLVASMDAPAMHASLTSSSVQSTAASSGAWLSLSWEAPAPLPASAPPAGYEAVACAAVPMDPSNAAAAVPSSAFPVIKQQQALPPSAASASSASGAAAAQVVGVGAVVARQLVGKGVTECKLEGLLPGSCYVLRLRSVGAEGAGHSSWGPDFAVTTPGQKPSQPPASGAGPGAKGGKKGKKGAASCAAAYSSAASACADSEEGVISRASSSPTMVAIGVLPLAGALVASRRASVARRATGNAKKILAAAAAPAAASRPPSSKKPLVRMLLPRWVRHHWGMLFWALLFFGVLGAYIKSALLP